jgi:diguanylate cyclase (GGDEF)-like protein
MQLQRNYSRLRTHQVAWIGAGTEQGIACDIRDFCPTGLFLRLADASAYFSGDASRKTPVTLTIDFSRISNRKPLTITGRVAHRSDAGIGVFVPQMADEVFQALLEYRAALYTAADEELRIELDPIDAETIRTQCLSLYRPFVEAIVPDMVLYLEKALRGERRAGVYVAERTMDSRARDLLGRAQDNVQRRFVEEALARVQAPLEQRRKEIPEPTVDELALVQEDEFEHWLSFEALIGKIEAGLEAPAAYFERLYRLLMRFEAAEKKSPGVPECSPFSPRALCQALHTALRDVRLPGDSRATVLQVFTAVVIARGRNLYEQLVKVAAVIERRHPAPQDAMRRVAEGASAKSEALPVSNIPVDSSLSALPVPNAQTESAPISEPSMGYDLGRVLSGLSTPNLRSVSTVGSHPASSSPSAERLGTAGMLRLLADRLGAITQSLQMPFAVPRHTHDSSVPVAASSELIRAIDALLDARRQTHPRNWRPLIEQLGSMVERFGRQPTRFDAIQTDVLNALGSLFDNATGEFVPSSDLTQLMRGFEGPFYKMALATPEFLSTTDHPARRLISTVDQFAIAADDNGKFFDPKLGDALTAVLRYLWSDDALDPAAHASAHAMLERMLRPLQKVRKQRVLLHQETSESKARALGARARVRQELETRVGYQRVPRIFMKLLVEGGWRQYLGLLELREGCSSAAWHEALTELKTILDWFESGTGGNRDHDVRVATIVASLRRRLSTLSMEPQRLLEELRVALLKLRPAGAAVVDRMELQPGWWTRGQDVDTEVARDDSRLVDRLIVGSWWNIAAAGGRMVPMQLVWMSNPPGRYAFVNRSATRKHEMSWAEFVNGEREGTIREGLDKALSVFERSDAGMVDSVYRELRRVSTRDPTTQLRNRKAFMEALRALSDGRRSSGERHSLAVIQFDQLRVVWHKYGLEARDALLREVATQIIKLLRPDDVLAALGDGSLAIHFPDCNVASARLAGERILDWIRTYRFKQADASLSVGANIGLMDFVPGDIDPDTVLVNADSACLQAAASGRNTVEIFRSADEGSSNQTLLRWAGRIDDILDRNGMYLRCQLVQPLDSNSGLSPYYEILLGVQDPSGNEVGPQPFVQAVEMSNRMHDVDIWVFENAFNWIRANPEAFARTGGFSLNLSALSMRRSEVLEFLHRELGSGTLPTHKISFEITETGAIGSYAAAQDFMNQVRGYGCKFSIDDFGSGFASYAHLKNLRTESLKIDGIFVKEMQQNPADSAMVRSMCEIGHSLGMRVVAEYVASEEILDAVRRIGVDYAQGFALHRPMLLEDLADRLLQPTFNSPMRSAAQRC